MTYVHTEVQMTTGFEANQIIFQTMMIDDCYSLKERDSCGKIVAGQQPLPASVFKSCN